MHELNALNNTDFVRALGGIYESSPWVAEACIGERPFRDSAHLTGSLARAVDAADAEAQLALICAHPDLGGKLGRSRELTAESHREQSRLGLDQLNDEEFDEFTDLNTRYVARFGFPFIFCVCKVETRAKILAAFRERVGSSEVEEKAEALRQIHQIAGNRLEGLFGS